MSSSSEDESDVEVPPKRRRRIAGKENHSPSPEDAKPAKKRRNGQSSGASNKKPRYQNCAQERPSSPLPGSSSQGPLINPGKILEVRLVNFMCHSNLKFTFGDKVNFISGKNGSGKSAILTALVLGLGGRTSDTNRGSSLARLLKNGETRGAIEITISNQGALSYEPEKYGESITIVRNINERASSYKLLSDKGKVVSTKKNELQLITMAFNIQVNNPVSILNQDTARSFLKTATPKELYGLFRKGTLIDEIEAKLEELKVRKLPLIMSLLKRKEQAHNDSVKDLVDYASKIEKHADLMKHQNEIVDIQGALSWFYVSELEEKLTTTEADKSEVEAKIERIRQSIESREAIEVNLKTKLEELEAQLQLASCACETVDQNHVELEQKVAYHKGIVNRKVSEIKKLQKKIETENCRCREIQAEIDNSQSRTQEVEQKRNQMVQKRSDLKKRCEELKAVISTTETHKQQLSDTVDEIERKVVQNQRYTENTVRSIKQKEEYIKGLRSAKNELRVFSEWMPNLVAEIDRLSERNVFKDKPRGPYGRYIKLKEDGWGPVAESVLSSCLKSFLVSNRGDAATMKKIMDKLNIRKEERPNITVTQFQNQVYDCSSTEVTHPRYKNLFRSIEISDPVVANSILDMFQPDTILLVPTTKETYPLVADERNVPINCKTVMNKDGTQFYPAPNYKCYSNRLPERTRFLQVSPAQAIRIAEQEMKTFKEEYKSHKKELDVGNIQLRKEKEELDVALRELDTLRRQLASCETKLFEVEQEDLPESFDMNVLNEDLEYRENLMETFKNQLEALEKDKDEALQACKSTKGAWLEKEKMKEELTKKREKIEKEITDAKNELRKYLTNHNHFKESLKMEMVKKDRYVEKLHHLNKEMEEALKTANEMCSERVRSQSSKQELEKKLNELSHTVRALEKVVGKKPAEPEEYGARMEKYKQVQASLQRVKCALEGLHRVYQDLEKTSVSVLNHVCGNTKYYFSRTLAKRNFVGEIIISHEKKTLTLNVKPDPTVEADTAITTLSGGERSYSMVAFIMALWQNMCTPFYFLDEFDVFMDEVNRKLIMELLMEHARRNTNRQFVFLTPHATSDESTQDVHFFRMEDPRG